YPAINAASLRYLVGDRNRAQSMASAVLAELAAWPADRRGYYEIATELEASLLLGRAGDSVARVRELRSLSGAMDQRARASTLRQLREIIAATGARDSLIAELRPP